MTNEELFADLKQFIEATVSQQTAHLDSRIDRVEKRIGDVEERMDSAEKHLNARIDIFDEKLDQVQDAIGEAFAQSANTTTTAIQDHEQRLHRLERRAA